MSTATTPAATYQPPTRPARSATNGRRETAADLVDEWFAVWTGLLDTQRQLVKALLGMVTPPER